MMGVPIDILWNDLCFLITVSIFFFLGWCFRRVQEEGEKIEEADRRFQREEGLSG